MYVYIYIYTASPKQVMARMNPNMAAIAEWRKKAAEFRLRQSELDAVPTCTPHPTPCTLQRATYT